MTTGGGVRSTASAARRRLLPDEGTQGYARIHRPRSLKRSASRSKWGSTGSVHVSGLINPTEGRNLHWTLDELKLVCDTAHQFDIPVVGHCRNAISTRDAAIAGFDMILHATYMDDEALKAGVDRKVPLVPTFTFQANLADFGVAIGSDEP